MDGTWETIFFKSPPDMFFQKKLGENSFYLSQIFTQKTNIIESHMYTMTGMLVGCRM